MSQTILITGASSGIGRAAALKFAAEGWNVVATMRRPEQEAELTQLPNVLVTGLDVEQPATIESAIEATLSRFGRLDAVVNNAGYAQNGLFEATTPAQVQQQFAVNVFGVMHVTRAVLPHFRRQRSGLLLNISSGAGRFTLPLLSLYAASKFALEGFSEALSHELAPLGITVKIIEPGGTHTNFNAVAGQQFAHDAALTDYQPFLDAAGQMFANMTTASISAEEVAAVTYAAATDGRATLRYSVGNADFHQRLAAVKQLPDQAYIESIRARYAPYLAPAQL
jgi:NAD(P)-dependent dehydrogenase (short-subunit alcohol dehydrogenase family)